MSKVICNTQPVNDIKMSEEIKDKIETPEEEERYDALVDICLSEQMTEVIEKREKRLNLEAIHVKDVNKIELELLQLGKYSYGWDVSIESPQERVASLAKEYKSAETQARQAKELADHAQKNYADLQQRHTETVQKNAQFTAQIAELETRVAHAEEARQETERSLDTLNGEHATLTRKLEILKSQKERMLNIAHADGTIDEESRGKKQKIDEWISDYTTRINSFADTYKQIQENYAVQSRDKDAAVATLHLAKTLAEETGKEMLRLTSEIAQQEQGSLQARLVATDLEAVRASLENTIRAYVAKYNAITQAAQKEEGRVRKKITGFIERRDNGSRDFTRRRIYLERVLELAEAVGYGRDNNQYNQEKNFWADAVYEFCAVSGRIEIADAETMIRVLAIKEQRRNGEAHIVLEEIEREVLFNYVIDREKQKSGLTVPFKDHQGSLGVTDAIITQATVITDNTETDTVKNAAQQTKNLIVLYNWGQAIYDKIPEENRAEIKLFCMQEMYRITAPDTQPTVWNIFYAQLLNERTKQMMGE